MTKALVMGRAIASGEKDPRELTEAALSAAEAAGVTFITRLKKRAEAQAAAAALRQKADCRYSLLDGVPFAWKDNVDIQGTLTTAGSKILAKHRAPAIADAVLVTRAEQAGLVSIGKTNLSELAFSSLGLNPGFGTPINPCDTTTPRVPGGSSSGSAAAVAAGVVPAAMGSDTAGSLRVPAAFNGLCAYRPSVGRHSVKGMTPLAASFDVPGVLATSIVDCLAVDDCLRLGQMQTRAAGQARRLQVHVDERVLDAEVTDPAIRHNLLAMAEQLAAKGVTVTYCPVAAVAETIDLIANDGWLGGAEGWVEYRWLVEADVANEMDDRVKQRLLRASTMSAETVISLYRHRSRLMEAIARELQGALLLMPTVGHVAPVLASVDSDPAYFAEVNLKTLRLTMVGSFLDMPTLAIPTGQNAEGQYTSLQLSAPQGEDERLLSAALTLDL